MARAILFIPTPRRAVTAIANIRPGKAHMASITRDIINISYASYIA